MYLILKNIFFIIKVKPSDDKRLNEVVYSLLTKSKIFALSINSEFEFKFFETAFPSKSTFSIS